MPQHFFWTYCVVWKEAVSWTKSGYDHRTRLSSARLQRCLFFPCSVHLNQLFVCVCKALKISRSRMVSVRLLLLCWQPFWINTPLCWLPIVRLLWFGTKDNTRGPSWQTLSVYSCQGKVSMLDGKTSQSEMMFSRFKIGKLCCSHRTKISHFFYLFNCGVKWGNGWLRAPQDRLEFTAVTERLHAYLGSYLPWRFYGF